METRKIRFEKDFPYRVCIEERTVYRDREYPRYPVMPDLADVINAMQRGEAVYECWFRLVVNINGEEELEMIVDERLKGKLPDISYFSSSKIDSTFFILSRPCLMSSLFEKLCQTARGIYLSVPQKIVDDCGLIRFDRVFIIEHRPGTLKCYPAKRGEVL